MCLLEENWNVKINMYKKENRDSLFLSHCLSLTKKLKKTKKKWTAFFKKSLQNIKFPRGLKMVTIDNFDIGIDWNGNIF